MEIIFLNYVIYQKKLTHKQRDGIRERRFSKNHFAVVDLT